jgi:uroporphyrin-III C-methyltransferase / precorrin-2 dehydrogenase / sirohydrochlorin ferrochelatase
MERLPLFLDLRDQPVTVVGGGVVAERKVRLLESAGARITVVAPTLTDTLAARAAAAALQHVPRTFVGSDADAALLASARLVIAATDDRAINTAVSEQARVRGIWVNVVDDAELSTALMPSIIDRSPVIVAVSTGGASPVLARRLRERLEALLEPSLGPLAALLARFRQRLIARWPDPSQRRRAVDALLDGELGAAAGAADLADAEQALERALAAATPDAIATGVVTLVGAGPGDAGLLTLQGLRALQRADVVLYDRLVSADVLALARRDADLIEVGKTGGGPSTSQERIHELLLEHGRAGKRVVRLKGGDPCVFGRGSEELEVLRAAGLRTEVVPGITTALALIGAGIPLTHRGLAAGVRLVTAQRAADGSEPEWASWAQTRDTLVVYMGTSAIETLQAELLRHGRAPDTPIAFVERVSLPTQRVIRGRLDAAATLAARHQVESPSIVVIGAVTRLAA